MPRDLSIKHPELLKIQQEEVTLNETEQSEVKSEVFAQVVNGFQNLSEEPSKWVHENGTQIIQIKKTSYKIVLPDGTELRGPKGRLRTWRDVEKASEAALLLER